MRRRKPQPEPEPPIADRTWSARTSVRSRDAGTDVVRFTPLPAETGPTRAPDTLSVWPLEGGRYGIDAHYHGATGIQRARQQLERLGEAGLVADIRPGPDAGATLRLGPLAHQAAWLAIEAFLGRPLDIAP